MKKTLLFVVGALMAALSFAQTEEDVTSYIQNPGFDEDISFNVDGSAAKEIVNTGKTSSRSAFWKAEDGSIYTKCNDGKGENAVGELSWYGFITRIKGWEVTNISETPEWVYFGSVPYAVQTGMLAVGDGKPAGDVGCPAKPESINTEDNKGVLMLRAGWGGKCTYKQVVNLPCAVYRLNYWVKATGKLNSGAKNLSNVTCRKDVYSDTEGFNAAEWTNHSIEFTPTSEFTIEFGFQAANTGSGNNPIIWIDGIRLYKIGEADVQQLLIADLTDVQGRLQELINEATTLGLSGLVTEMSDYFDEIDGVIGAEQAVMEAALKKANTDFETFRSAIDALPALEAVLGKMQNLMANTDYAGKGDLAAAYEAIAAYKANGTAAQIIGASEEANAAIKAYYLTQEASVDHPADYTFLVNHPWFIKPEAEPIYDSGNYMYAVESPDSYLTIDGWYKGEATGGDQRLNYTQGRSCWNAWNNNFTTTMSINQELTDLPNGYYKVSADLITQAGYITNQHVYAKSSAQTAVSATLSKEGWDALGTDIGDWETLITNEKVLVSDGKLTIGAEGTGNGQASAGWFCATNFKLYYLGEANAEDLLKAFNQKIADAEQLANNMHFAADKQAFMEVIEANRNATDMNEALAAISEAQAVAEKSEAKYAEYMQEGKTLPVVKAELEKEDGYGAARSIVEFAYNEVTNWMVSDEATYTMLEAKVELLKNYLNTYAPVYNEAAAVAETASESGKSHLESIMNAQKTQLIAELKDADAVKAFVEELQKVTAAVNKQNIIDNASATDYTGFIINPKAEAETGWIIERGTGDKASASGQWYTGNGDVRYFDSYNSEAGKLNYYAEQLITDLPNGTYTLGAYTRTSGEGAFLFYKNTADTTWVEIPMQTYTHIDENTGETVTESATDKWGEIWEAAKLRMEAGISEDDPEYAEVNAIYNANNGNGRGWKHISMTDIVVTDHQMLIGMTTDAGRTGKAFTGTWFSVGGWTLTLTAKGDNTGWEGPIATGIDSLTEMNLSGGDIYTLSGVKTSKLRSGLNIIIKNGKAQKVFMK